MDGGEFRVVGLHVLNAHSDAGEVAGALSVRLFHAGTGNRQAIRAVGRPAGLDGAPWSAGHRPRQGSPASPLPLQTTDRLLDRLQPARPARATDAPAQRGAAIAAFQSRRGLPVTGLASLDLLGSLIQATP